MFARRGSAELQSHTLRKQQHLTNLIKTIISCEQRRVDSVLAFSVVAVKLSVWRVAETLFVAAS